MSNRHATKHVAAALKQKGSNLKTGKVVSYDAYTAVVNINGQYLTMKLLDSVTVAIGRVAVCVVQGQTGFVVGTLDSNARVPNLDNIDDDILASTAAAKRLSGMSYYAPVAAYQASYDDTAATADRRWDATGDPFYTGANTHTDGAYGAVVWFYGANRFDELLSKKIQSVEIYLPLSSAEETTAGNGDNVIIAQHWEIEKGTVPPDLSNAGWHNSHAVVDADYKTQPRWATLPADMLTFANGDIYGSEQTYNNTGNGGFMALTTSGFTALDGTPALGTIRVTWSR